MINKPCHQQADAGKRYQRMPKSPKSKFLQYHNAQIDGWDLMSWAAQIDRESIYDTQALDELINLDDFWANGHHESVEQLVYRTIPDKDRKPLGELLILDAFSQLEKGTINSSAFVSVFLDSFYDEIDESEEECSEWIYRVFNENNGFGFLALEEMSNHDLAEYIKTEMER